MNNDELKKKIAQIIADYFCPQRNEHKNLWGDDRLCYSKMNFAECEWVAECTDALIAEVIGDVDVIGGLVSAENVASLLQTFIPRIISSSTDAVPCGGVVRAESPSCETEAGGILLRGAAGGYAGHNNGGRIEGESTDNPAKAERKIGRAHV